MSNSVVHLMITTGHHGTEQRHCINVPVDETVMRELMEPIEISNDPFTVALSSMDRRVPIDSFYTYRNSKFKMRDDISRKIANALVNALTEYFGNGDTIDGYRKDQRNG